MNGASTNYLHPSEALRARGAREQGAIEASRATEITVTMPAPAAVAFSQWVEDRVSEADARANDESKGDDHRAFWRGRAAYWNGVYETIDAALVAGKVAR